MKLSNVNVIDVNKSNKINKFNNMVKDSITLVAFVALILFPFIEKKIFSNTLNQILLGSILLTIISIIFLFIFLNTNLYDELRHILYLIPLILISSFSIIYFYSKKLLKYIVLFSVFIFTIQNINMYPYQYTWFNPFSNFIDLNKNFEIDYWGVSGKNIAKKINQSKKLLLNNDSCIYVSPKHIIEPFLSSQFKCITVYTSIYPKSSEKYILVKYMKNIRRVNPDNCELIFELDLFALGDMNLSNLFSPSSFLISIIARIFGHPFIVNSSEKI